MSESHDVPQFFRLNIEVGDLEAAISFYSQLLGIEGRKRPGSRCYFDCGAVTLQVVDVSSVGTPHPAAKALYFAVVDLQAVFAALWGVPGASARFMRKTRGRIRCASSNRERSTDKMEPTVAIAGIISVTPGNETCGFLGVS